MQANPGKFQAKAVAKKTHSEFKLRVSLWPSTAIYEIACELGGSNHNANYCTVICNVIAEVYKKIHSILQCVF